MFTMKEVCEITGLTYESLKYYCKTGLIPDVQRDENNRRVFTQANLDWIREMLWLKQSNMSIDDLKYFISLCEKGVETIPNRQEILRNQRDKIMRQIETLHLALVDVDIKLIYYADILSGKTEYVSDLAPRKFD